MNNQLTALCAIAAVMMVGCGFGYVLRGLVEKAKQDDSGWFYDGAEADHDRWENDPEPTSKCDTCRWDRVPIWNAEAHCISCENYDEWEAKG